MAIALHFPKTQFIIFVTILLFFSPSISSSNFPIAKPNCVDRCGNISIPFPFGTTEGCYYNSSFLVICNHTHYDPPVAFYTNSTINITDISLKGQIRFWQFISKDCYSKNGTSVLHTNPWITVPTGFTVNNTANKFVGIGCDTYGFVYGNQFNGRYYETGCTSLCTRKDDLHDGSCSGIGCCKTSIPTQVWRVELRARSYNNFTRSYDDNQTTVWDFNNCSYGLIVEDTEFTFSASSLSSLMNVDKLPMVVDWAVGEGTCEVARNNLSSYACKSVNSKCYKPENGNGYRCDCEDGYEGNPYLDAGCRDIDECRDLKLNNCEKTCENTMGGYKCVCPRGYHGDGKKWGQGCTRSTNQSLAFKFIAGIASGVIVLLLVAFCLYLEVKRRKWITMKRKFFLQNGGLLLQEKLIRRGNSTNATKLFTSVELKRATDNFHASRIVGQGGFGTVYKGFLQDNRIVAVKKSKEVDPNQVEQFINEVIVLSQINHRNVVKLLGCCLETQVPLLVYEFINNGTLFEHINHKTKARNLTWDKRLTIAVESAGVLAYLHSAASPPIIHRDVKSANILLDANFTAKVSDFGASRLVPIDQTQLSTVVQGTMGYLDPEYMQTNQLTEKSDVYSFGVVLVELLTGLKALRYDKREDERNLASYFLSTLKQSLLFNILDGNIVLEGNNEELILVAMLAERCLQVRGNDRPSMKEVATELESVRVTRKHSWAQTEAEAEEMEVLLSIEMNTFSNGESTSTGIGYGIDSMSDHILPPIGGAR